MVGYPDLVKEILPEEVKHYWAGKKGESKPHIESEVNRRIGKSHLRRGVREKDGKKIRLISRRSEVTGASRKRERPMVRREQPNPDSPERDYGLGEGFTSCNGLEWGEKIARGIQSRILSSSFEVREKLRAGSGEGARRNGGGQEKALISTPSGFNKGNPGIKTCC